MIATLILLIVTPPGSAAFWWTLVAFAALVAMQAVYWLVTHPVNKFWLKDQKLGAAGSGFFGFDPMRRGQPEQRRGDDVWLHARDRWEYSHVLRAVLAAIALVALIVAVAIQAEAR